MILEKKKMTYFLLIGQYTEFDSPVVVEEQFQYNVLSYLITFLYWLKFYKERIPFF